MLRLQTYFLFRLMKLRAQEEKHLMFQYFENMIKSGFLE
jgi:hypothetical protein